MLHRSSKREGQLETDQQRLACAALSLITHSKPVHTAPQVKRKKGEEFNETEEEERCVSIISSLLSNLARGSRRDRTCAKFVENEFEKCDHIMELYTRYDARVRAEEVRCWANRAGCLTWHQQMLTWQALSEQSRLCMHCS